MPRHASCVPSDTPGSDVTPFLDDVRHNLVAARRAYGLNSNAYRQLVRHYRAVADTVGCQRELDRLLHLLPTRYVHGKTKSTSNLDP